MPGILDGVRVLELGGYVSAPYCARLLADYGADVIKIEPPGGGDEARRMGPFAGDDPHPDKSIPFLYLNTNKRGITLDPSTAAGANLLGELLKTADVLVENYPPGDKPAPCLETDHLIEKFPHLIVTSITPFGQTGPYRDFAATDIVTTAISGLMYHSGDSDQEPLRNALNQSFYVAGINGAVATTAALFQRLFTGRGQSIDVSTVECLASHLVQAVPYYSYMGAIKGRRPVRGSGFEELMPARDGYVIPSVQGSQPWNTVAELIGVPELQDERFASGAGRIEFGEEIHELLIKGLAQWDRKALHQASGERRLVFGMAQDAGDLHDCPHLRERDFFRTVDHPVAGAADYPGMGPRLSGPDALPVEYEVRRPAPLLGQHNGEIYGDELGRSPGELAQLRALGVI
ncbi:MAG: CoA transferase [Dehalococcoidia bacterium]|nr:CoA transferase [Dehalococcoidia bacterium]